MMFQAHGRNFLATLYVHEVLVFAARQWTHVMLLAVVNNTLLYRVLHSAAAAANAK